MEFEFTKKRFLATILVSLLLGASATFMGVALFYDSDSEVSVSCPGEDFEAILASSINERLVAAEYHFGEEEYQIGFEFVRAGSDIAWAALHTCDSEEDDFFESIYTSMMFECLALENEDDCKRVVSDVRDRLDSRYDFEENKKLENETV